MLERRLHPHLLELGDRKLEVRLRLGLLRLVAGEEKLRQPESQGLALAEPESARGMTCDNRLTWERRA